MKNMFSTVCCIAIGAFIFVGYIGNIMAFRVMDSSWSLRATVRLFGILVLPYGAVFGFLDF